MIYTKDGVEYTDKYWACSCPEDHVHPKEFGIEFCPLCGDMAEGSPDAVVKEVLYMNPQLTQADL